MDLKKQMYLEALDHFIDYSSGDSTAVIAREHGLFGLASLLACIKNLGLPYDDTMMIALPDFTYTRNKNRWDAGFPYGCIIRLPQFQAPFIPIDFRPNCCGVAFAEISKSFETFNELRIKYDNVIKKLSKIERSDLNRGNHFLAIYKAQKDEKYYCLLHCSFKFAKNELYREHNDLLNKAYKFSFFANDIHYLIGDDALKFYSTYIQLEEESLALREQILENLFTETHMLFNQTHEGFLNMGTLLLGAYASQADFEFPLMISPNHDLFLVRVNTPINLRHGNQLYCAPHGAGYALNSVVSAEACDFCGSEEYILTYPNHCAFLTNNIIDMPFCYRESAVYDWCERYNMGCVLDTLTPLINIKL